MSKSLLCNFGPAIVSDNTTRYVPIVGGITNAISTEADAEIPIRDAGTLSNLLTNLTTNTLGSQSTSITLRVNRAHTASPLIQTVYAFEETGVKLDTESFGIAATDEVDIDITVPSEVGNKSVTCAFVALEFAPTTTSNCISFLGVAGGGVGFSVASTERYYPPTGGFTNVQSDETETKYRARLAFTSSDLFVNVTANTRSSSSTTFRTRKNGSNGGQTLTFSASESGQKEDTSGTDSLAVGDDFNYQIVTGSGSGTITTSTISTTAINTSDLFVFLAASGVNGGSSYPAGYLDYPSVTTGVAANNTTDEAAFYSVYPQFTFTAKEMIGNVSANTMTTGTFTITLRETGVDSALAISWAITQTGIKNNNTTQVVITSGTDKITEKAHNSDLVGSATFRWCGFLGSTAPPVNVHPFMDHHLEVFPPTAVAY